MNVKRERQMAPKTPTFTVWADNDRPHCIAHGTDCEHAHTVADKVGVPR